MDFSYDPNYLHSSRRAGPGLSQGARSAKRLAKSRSYASLFEAGTQCIRRPVGTAKAVAYQTVRFQYDSWCLAASLAWHPTSAISKAGDLALHPLDTYHTFVNTYLTPIWSSDDSDGAADNEVSNTRVQFDLAPTVTRVENQDLRNANERIARRARLKLELQAASSWSDYEETAKRLGEFDGHETWRAEEPSDLYDVECVKNRLQSLQEAHMCDDLQKMLQLVRTQLTRDLGGISNAALFHSERIGTKIVIEQYIDTVRTVLSRLTSACARSDQRLKKNEVYEELKATRQAFGRTALLFSGGGTLGMLHIGVIKALFEANALPRIISGSSAGSIVCAVLCTQYDQDIPNALNEFCDGELAVFVGAHEKPGFVARSDYFLRNGHLFDVSNLKGRMMELLGPTTTFLEAYNKTRRVLNITVSSAGKFGTRQVLNYSTAENVIIWSAVVASCAVPFGYKPAQLMYKNPETDIVEPWDQFTTHRDGSVEGDVRRDKVSAEFDVNHFIVSQVNPHVVPFLDDDRSVKGFASQLYNTAGNLAKDEGMQRLRNLANCGICPSWSKMGRSVLRQQYTGDITILPSKPINPFTNVLANPTPDFMADAKRKGELATLPLLDMIKSRLEIEMLIDKAMDLTTVHLNFSKSASNLRYMQMKSNAKSKAPARGGFPRPDSSGSQQSARTIPAHPVQVRVSDHRAIKSMVDPPSDLLQIPGIKIAGEPDSPASSSSESRPSFVLDTDDDDTNAEDEESYTSPDIRPEEQAPPANHFAYTAPNSPLATAKKSFFDTPKGTPKASPRATSPASVPVSLVMTPSSPEARSKQRVDDGFNPVATAKSPPPSPGPSRSRSPSGFLGSGVVFGEHKKLSKFAKGLKTKRSGSTGKPGVPPPKKQ